MLAYRKSGEDGYIEIEVDVNSKGEPLLPEDATVEPPPPYKKGHSLTIENNEWVYIKNPEPKKPTIEEMRYLKNILFTPWSQEFLNQAFIYDGEIYVNDARFREMLNSSISAHREWGTLPDFWVTAEDKIIKPVTKDFLDGIGKVAYQAHQKSMLEVVEIKNFINTCTDVDELSKLEFPEPKTVSNIRD